MVRTKSDVLMGMLPCEEDVVFDLGSAARACPRVFPRGTPESATLAAPLTSASGERTPNSGMRQMQLLLSDMHGQLTRVESELVPATVAKPIWNAGRSTGSGFRAMLDDDASYVEAKTSLQDVGACRGGRATCTSSGSGSRRP